MTGQPLPEPSGARPDDGTADRGTAEAGPAATGPTATGPAATGPARLGALRDTLAIVTSAATGAGRAADRARGLAERLGDDRDRLLLELGGGPPRELRQTAAASREALTALDEAAAALAETATALRAFARRST
ncbi:MAG TPA: hypothetical protein VI248_25295 [Kineosporiaceae bacterium]